VLGVVGGAVVAGGVATGLAFGLRGSGGPNVPPGFHDLGGLPLGSR
jgi:hypothetical protein